MPNCRHVAAISKKNYYTRLRVSILKPLIPINVLTQTDSHFKQYKLFQCFNLQKIYKKIYNKFFQRQLTSK